MARLSVVRELDLPITEASGLCSFAGMDGQERVALIGDATNELAIAPVTDGGRLDWEQHDLTTFADAPPELSQLEAIAYAGATSLVVLGEEPSLLAAVDVAGSRFLGCWHLSPDSDGDLRKVWNRDENSRGEALLLGPSGHVLIIKEKNPILVVEFGPAGDAALITDPGTWGTTPWQPPPGAELAALAWSQLDTTLDDVSDAHAFEERIMLLSDQNCVLAELTVTAGDWQVGRAIKLDKMIEKPEGLTRLSDGRWFVAVDQDDYRAALLEIESPL